MIVALMVGRSGSKGFPGKNIKKVLKYQMCEYPLISANKSKYVEKVFVSTDCPIIKKLALKHKAAFIKRPKSLTTDKALGEDVFKHGFEQIKRKYKNIELLVLLFANAPTVSSKMIDSGVETLLKNENYDSAVSVSIYNMWSPLRARKLDKNGLLIPFVPFKYFGNPKTLNCDRDSQGNVYFADMSVSIVRPRCFFNMKNNLLPQRWMGKKIAPIFSSYGLDLDYDWQLGQVKHWIKKNFK